MHEVKISNIQLGLLAMGFFYGNTATSNPALQAKRDAWLASIIAYMLGALFIAIYLYIAKLNPDKTLTQILESCFGKIVGKAIGIIYVWVFIHKAGINTRAFGEFIIQTSYPETPLGFILAIFLLAVYYVTRNGLDKIGRVCEIIVPIIPIPILVVSTAITSLPNYTAFKPMLLEIPPIIKGSISMAFLNFGDAVAFLMIIPFVNDKKRIFKSVYIGLITFAALHMLITMRNIMLVGPALIDYISYPAHVSAQLIPGISIEPLVDLNLLLGGGIKVVIFLYAATKATAEVFGINSYMPLVSAFSVFLLIMSHWVFKNSFGLQEWAKSTALPIYSAPFELIIPLILLTISIIKYKRRSVTAKS